MSNVRRRSPTWSRWRGPGSSGPGTSTTGPTAPSPPRSSGVLFGPYLIAIAEEAAVDDRVSVLGLSIAPGRAPGATSSPSRPCISAFILPVLGAVADRTSRKKDLLAGFAWAGAVLRRAAVLHDRRQLAARRDHLHPRQPVLRGVGGRQRLDPAADLHRGTTATGSPRAAGPTGYAGGGLLLALNFVLVSFHDTFGLDRGHGGADLAAVGRRVVGGASPSSRSAGCATTRRSTSSTVEGGVLQRSFGQLWVTLKELRNYPVALTFLLAYLFFNDGIQTVISQASVYGVGGARLRDRAPCSATYLLVQFVAVGGALLLRPARGGIGAKNTILGRPGRLDGHRHRRRCSCPRSRSCRSCCSAPPSASCSAAPRRWPAPTSRC